MTNIVYLELLLTYIYDWKKVLFKIWSGEGDKNASFDGEFLLVCDFFRESSRRVKE